VVLHEAGDALLAQLGRDVGVDQLPESGLTGLA
jgi:hypothetical protein